MNSPIQSSAVSANDVDSRAQSNKVAEKLRALLDEPYVLSFQPAGRSAKTVEHHCTASIGVVAFKDQEGNQDDILKWADAAMYHAKEAGGNLIRYHAFST
jgi:diguanylate cyclase (GGDEF)-like protein